MQEKKIEHLLSVSISSDLQIQAAQELLSAWDFTASLNSVEAALGICIMLRSRGY